MLECLRYFNGSVLLRELKYRRYSAWRAPRRALQMVFCLCLSRPRDKRISGVAGTAPRYTINENYKIYSKYICLNTERDTKERGIPKLAMQ